ncbi:MAG TPA: hypothetical protein DCQ92_16180 [Verrucomicrobia subdivision 3 bacterium]|nr:hypothetical protein [Limisphaerales bacterium]
MSQSLFDKIYSASRNSDQAKSLNRLFNRSGILFTELAVFDVAKPQKFYKCWSGKTTKWRPLFSINNNPFAPSFNNKSFGLVNIVKPVGDISIYLALFLCCKRTA